MSDKVKYLDCCENPVLETVKSLYLSRHDAEALRQCQHCKHYWFYRFSEYVSYDSDDDLTVWYSPLSSEEATRILEAGDQADLAFLNERPGFIEDRDGIRRTTGQPSHPRS